MEKFVRFEQNGTVRFGALENDKILVLDGDFLSGCARRTGERVALADARLLAPVVPPNVIAIGLNYKRHAMETKHHFPERAVIFLKATTSVLNPGDAIMLPAIAPDEVDYEAELAIVIGKRAKNLSEADALSVVFGYTCANDVSARDCQTRLDTQWARGKSFDTFCPLGPCVATGLDGDALPIRCRLNGAVMQDSNTSDMIFGVRQIVSFCSRNMTLLPGTVILTGTPEGVGFTRTPPVFLRAGDRVEAEIDGIGTLVNPVVREKL